MNKQLLFIYIFIFDGEFAYEKDMGACWKFWKELLKGTKILFCERASKCFLSLGGTKSKTKDNLLLYLFQLNTQRGTYTKKAPALDHFEQQVFFAGCRVQVEI